MKLEQIINLKLSKMIIIIVCLSLFISLYWSKDASVQLYMIHEAKSIPVYEIKDISISRNYYNSIHVSNLLRNFLTTMNEIDNIHFVKSQLRSAYKNRIFTLDTVQEAITKSTGYRSIPLNQYEYQLNENFSKMEYDRLIKKLKTSPRLHEYIPTIKI